MMKRWVLANDGLRFNYYFLVTMAKLGDQGNLKKKEFNGLMGLRAGPQEQQQGWCESKNRMLKDYILYHKHKANRKYSKSANTQSLHPVISSINASQPS